MLKAALIGLAYSATRLRGSALAERAAARPREAAPSPAVVADRKRRNRIGFDPNLKNLLIVAGVSGAGKSTFIDELVGKRLPPEIASALPPDAADWNVVHAPAPHPLIAKLRRRRTARGQILHHEITTLFRPELTDAVHSAPRACSVGEDTLLQRRLAAAESIHLVIVGGPASQIIRQLSLRSVLLHVPSTLRSAAAPLAPLLQRLESALPQRITDNASKLGRRWRHRSAVRARYDELIALYSEPGALDALYEYWIDTLLDECGARIKGSVVHVEPATGVGRAAFRLAHRQGKRQGSLRCKLERGKNLALCFFVPLIGNPDVALFGSTLAA